MQTAAQFLSITEAAIQTGMERQSFWQQVKKGKIKANRIGATWVVSVAEVRKYRSDRIADLKRKLAKLEAAEKGAK